MTGMRDVSFNLETSVPRREVEKAIVNMGVEARTT